MKLTDQLFHCIFKWRLEHRKKELLRDSELLDFCLFTFEVQSVRTDGPAIFQMELLYFVSVSKYKTETSRGQITWKIKDNAKKTKQSLK